MYRLSFTIFLLVCIAFPCKKATAQAFIREDRPFTYGTLIITDNTAPRSMRIRRNGNINPIDPELIQIGTVNSAQFDFRRFPTNTALIVTFTPTTLTGPGGNFFNITAFELPGNMTTNNSGHRNNRRIGSTIETSGNGLPYTDGAYTGTVFIEAVF